MRRAAALATVAAIALAGCGGSGEPKPPPGVSQSEFDRQLANARSVTAADFPPAKGRTVEKIAGSLGAQQGPQAVVASSEFLPGANRVAFGVLDAKQRPVYGKTAVYIARTLKAPAQGPYPAPADSLITEPRYRSRQAASEDTPLASIYAARARFPKPGKYVVLAVTKRGTTTYASALGVKVKANSPIPAVGERPPAVDTDTVESAAGVESDIDTRLPPAPELHQVNFKDVLGKKPVALLFATPQLCQSRVCGPVVDIELQMKQKYGDRMTFIHQEVYRDNKIEKGLRPPLQAFGLQTEPWLFTIGSDGRVAARLEGSFGVAAFEGAIKAALD